MRQCGSCSLCCKLPEIAELSKPGNRWCCHCRPGEGGCGIYEYRPRACREFKCQWLADGKLGDEWQPQRAHMFMYFDSAADPLLCRVMVDPAHPQAWQREPYRSQLAFVANVGLRGTLGNHFHTVVCVGSRAWLIHPAGEHEITGMAYVVEEAAGTWAVHTFATREAAVEHQRGYITGR